MIFLWSRKPSAIAIDAQVLPTPKPWYKRRLLYGVWNDKKFLTNCWCGDNSNSALENYDVQ